MPELMWMRMKMTLTIQSKKTINQCLIKNTLTIIFLKRDKTGVFYDLLGLSTQNSEDYDPSSWNSKTLVTKGYADMKDNLKADKTELAKKADLETSDEQTFKGILNVPDFDSGYSNMTNVMNKKYIDDQDVKKADKTYVDTEIQKVTFDTSSVVLIDGSNSMNADLNIGNNKITYLKTPTNDSDAVNKKYVDSHIDKNIQSSNDNNVFEYVMNDPDSQLSEEDDIELGGLETYNSSPHQVNKNVVDMKLLLDSSKGYYSSRLGINLYPLKNDDFTICFELFWIDPFVNTIFINGVSSIETIHNVNKKIFLSQKYARLVCQFTKSQNIGNNYLYIDLEIKLNPRKLYQLKFQTFFVVYGIDSLKSDVDPSLYDALIHYQNGYVFFNADIDMYGKKIIGIKEDTDDSGAVNFKQLMSFNDSLKISLENKIKLLQPKSYYNEVFEYYFDLLDPSSFDMDKTYGTNIKSVGGKLFLRNTVSLNEYDPKKGFSLEGSSIKLDTNLSQNSDYTIFVSFQHDTKFLLPSNNIF